MEHMNQLEEDHANSSPTNPALIVPAPGASASSQPPLPAASSVNSHTTPTILSEHQSYLCSWYNHDSGTECDHVAPDRRAFLRHVGAVHHVSGDPHTTIICGLLDSKMGLTCKATIKRANFPRHLDTHYPLRYQCNICPVGTSFSRQDTWKKHVRIKHA